MARTPLSEVRLSKLPVHPIFLIAPFAVVAWVITLAGLAATTSECNDVNPTSYCAAQLGLEWMAVVFQAVAFIAISAIVATKFGTYCRYLFAVILTILTVLHMQFTQDALVVLESDERRALKSSYKSAVQCYAAGAVFLIIIDLLLIAYLTLDIDATAVDAVIKKKAVDPAPQTHAPAVVVQSQHPASEVAPPV